VRGRERGSEPVVDGSRGEGTRGYGGEEGDGMRGGGGVEGGCINVKRKEGKRGGGGGGGNGG